MGGVRKVASARSGHGLGRSPQRRGADAAVVAADMQSAQSEGERTLKGRGQQASGSEDGAAHVHGGVRLVQAFDLAQMVWNSVHSVPA